MSFTRSKRLRTERLPPTVPVALSVECLDISVYCVKGLPASLRKGGRHLYSKSPQIASQIYVFFLRGLIRLPESATGKGGDEAFDLHAHQQRSEFACGHAQGGAEGV